MMAFKEKDLKLAEMSTDFPTQEERIAARRLRIQNKQQESERAVQGLEKTEEPTSQLTTGQTQMLKSDELIAKISHDSTSLVANVRQAAELDQTRGRQNNAALKLLLRQHLENEEIIVASQLQDISAKWQHLLDIHAPIELRDQMREQKTACEAIIARKDQLIRQLREEVENNETRYGNSIEKEEEDIRMTIARTKEQINLLSQSYTKELNNIEDALAEEWKKLLDSQVNEWKDKIHSLGIKDDERLQITQDIFDKCEQELDELRRQKANEHSKLRNELENDIQILEQHLQQLKVHLHLNHEKLEYGYQVLKKREEEQLIVRAQQKRKLTKLQDQCTQLKAKIEKREKLKQDKQYRLQADCTKSDQQIQELHKKYRHFQIVNDKKMRDLWFMNDEVARHLVEEFLKIDREISERILNVEWTQPELFFNSDLYDPSANGTGDKISSSHHSRRLRWIFEIGLMAVRSRKVKPFKRPKSKSEVDITPNVRRDILIALSNEASFLVEKRDKISTAHISTEEQHLIKLDGIFSALHIERDDEIEALIRYLFKKCYQLPASQRPLNSDSHFPDSQDFTTAIKLPPLKTDKTSTSQSSGNIDNTVILKAVEEFLQTRNEKQKSKKTFQESTEITEELITDAEIDAYWSQYFNLLPPFRLQLWDTVLNGLEKLRQIEAERAQLRQTNFNLFKQNNDLKLLLSQYLRSRALG